MGADGLGGLDFIFLLVSCSALATGELNAFFHCTRGFVSR